jgi:hypothetical protein
MRNKISLRMLFVLLTVSVLIAALLRNDGKSGWSIGLLMLIELAIFTFGLYALLFCLAYPLGRLNKYFLDRSDSGQSPFATDRLPQQILPPPQRNSD